MLTPHGETAIPAAMTMAGTDVAHQTPISIAAVKHRSTSVTCRCVGLGITEGGERSAGRLCKAEAPLA